jgi:SAM-dependent methyltransferase
MGAAREVGAGARYDGLADWYESTAAPSAEYSAEALRDLLGDGAGVCLDLGCGTGLYGDILRGTGRYVIGLDISRDQLRLAREREVVVGGDASRLPFRDSSLDDVAAIWVHGDLDDLPATLSEVARVLRPGGRFVLFGIHPCFNGPCVENRTDGARVVHPNYRESGWHRSAPWWGPGGIRSNVGVRHRTLAELLNDLLRSPLRLDRVVEPRDDPIPAVLALVAHRPA